MIHQNEIEKLILNDFTKIVNTKIVYQFAEYNDALYEIILKQSLKFSDPRTFNDPFDCNEKLLTINYDEDYVEETISQITKSLSRSEKRELKRKFRNPANQAEIMRNKLKEYKLSCFSENYKEVLMWSHYSKKHTGICVGFDFPHKYIDKFILCPVNYFKILKPLDGKTDLYRVILYWLTTKSMRWNYEAEIRAITKSKTSDKHEFIKFDPKYIKEIIFGCNVTEQEINEALVIIKRSTLPYHKITVKKMEIDEKTFLLKERLIKH